MKFYERILQELKTEPHTFQTIYKHAFSFSKHVYFEQSSNLRIQRVTYAQARLQVLQFTSVLKGMVQPGSTVAIMLPNGPLWVQSFWAVLQAGCKVMLLSPMMPETLAKKCLDHAGCAIVIANASINGCVTITPDILQQPVQTPCTQEQWDNWGDEVILATSSTTGEPKILGYNGKAICEQVLNSQSILQNCKEVARFDHGVIRMLAFLPFSHIFGLTACFLWFTMFGITFVFLKDLQPETILRTCRLHRVTHVFAVPLLWDTMAARIQKTVEEKNITKAFQKLCGISLKLQSAVPPLGRFFAARAFASVQKQTLGKAIKYCISGGGMLSKNTLPLINAVGYPLENGYGMTEIGVASLSNQKAAKRCGLGVGKPMPSLQFKLDEEGQLLVRGTSCYTARYINGQRHLRDTAAFFATGDIFTVDEHGEYSCIGRMDDLVNGANGERLSPDTVENQMALAVEHCVFGMEDGSLALMLYLPDECRLTEKAWRAQLAEISTAIDSLPTYMRPRQIFLSAQKLPLSLSGKIRRQAIRRDVLNNTYPCQKLSSLLVAERASGEEVDEGLVNAMKELFAQHSNADAPVEANSNFFTDLGGDSLSFLELIGAIETRYNITVTNELSAGMTTPMAAAIRVIQCLETEQRGKVG